MEENTPIISFKDADIINGEATVIYGLEMKVYPGDFVYIVGKVGTGKTSIIRTIIAENPLGKGNGCVCGFDGLCDRIYLKCCLVVHIFSTAFYILFYRRVHKSADAGKC